MVMIGVVEAFGIAISKRLYFRLDFAHLPVIITADVFVSFQEILNFGELDLRFTSGRLVEGHDVLATFDGHCHFAACKIKLSAQEASENNVFQSPL